MVVVKAIVLILTVSQTATSVDDDTIIFGDEKSIVVPNLATGEPTLSDDEDLNVRQKLFSTFRQAGLRENSICKNARFESGACLTLRQCPALLQIARNPQSKDYPFLQSSYCGLFRGSQYFCCKTTSGIGQTSTAPPSRPTTTAAPSSCNTAANINFPSCGSSQGLGNRVVGGKSAVKNSSPWIVLVLREKVPICGASLITNEYVLSAAHCFVQSTTGEITPEKDITLRMAEHDTSTTTDGKHYDVQAEKIKAHEGYNSKDFRNDIAIVKLKAKLCFSSRVMPICIPDPSWNSRNLESYKAIVAGWGLTKPAGFEATVLQQAEISIYNTNVCRANYSVTYKKQAAAIDDTTICSGDALGGVDSCSGDSGGPLVLPSGGKYYLVGIVSRGPAYCGTRGLPGIYTRVSKYYDWILKNIR